MENDGGKPNQGLPPSFQPGSTRSLEGMTLWRDNVCWQVLGISGTSVFVRRGETTCWIELLRPQPENAPISPVAASDEIDSVCPCIGAQSPGFSYDPPTGMWVHYDCRKPKRLYLQNMINQQTGEVW